AVFSNDDGVPGVVSAGHARNVIDRTGEIVDDFALSFISPLCADHRDGFHSSPSPHTFRPVGAGAQWTGAAPFPLCHILTGKFLAGICGKQQFRILRSPRPQRKQAPRSPAVSELWWGEALGSGFCCV